ncbi:MAG: substrate-binding domain-containing protein [Candidatus Erginobacter occultus]|nr:substrate-binding domain-containing protein [Candidatus Erginobacter occultus]
MIRIRYVLTVGLLAWFLYAAGPGAAEVTCTETYGEGTEIFSLATGSPGELGLLRALAESFCPAAEARLCWVKAGSGASLALLEKDEVDMVMVHAPAAEKAAVAEGWAARRTLIGSNEFYIVGPGSDPAGIADAETAAEAYRKIAESESKFLSRGDNSGTHKKELAVWGQAGIAPAGDWYVVTGDFMTATLKRADTEGGYFMTDSSTWIAEREAMPNLKVLFRGDPFLVNTYHALCRSQPAESAPSPASRFIDFVASESGQEIIRGYGAVDGGEGLYNDAAYARQFEKD